MAAVTAPPGGSLLGKLVSGLQERSKAKGRKSRLAALVTDHLLTVVALGAGVADAFLNGGSAWGLGVLVPAVLVLDYKLQG